MPAFDTLPLRTIALPPWTNSCGEVAAQKDPIAGIGKLLKFHPVVPFAARRRRGSMLLEILLGLAILAMAIAGVMLFYNQSVNQQNATATVEEVIQLSTAVHQMYAGSTSYAGLSTLAVYNSKLLDHKYFSDEGNTLNTPGGGQILGLNGTRAFDTAVMNFWIYYASRETCIQIATADWGDMIEDRNINGNSYSDNVFTPSMADGACKSGNNNEIGFNLY